MEVGHVVRACVDDPDDDPRVASREVESATDVGDVELPLEGQVRPGIERPDERVVRHARHMARWADRRDVPDSLIGGAGRDLLIGGPARDKLNGGNGRDSCKGGGGRDTAISCELSSSIP